MMSDISPARKKGPLNMLDRPLLNFAFCIDFSNGFVVCMEKHQICRNFRKIRNIQVDENFMCRDNFDVDLTKLDPVIYSGMYHSIGNLLGKIGDV